MWACPHLTSLLADGATLELPKDTAVLLSGLRQLQISECVLPGDAFPAALCSGLGQLGSLALLDCDLAAGLPPAFSQLRQGTLALRSVNVG